MPVISIAAIDHLVLRTTRMDEMVSFYCDVLGCAKELDRLSELGLMQLRAGTALIDLVAVDSLLGRQGGGPPTATENNLDHFCLQVSPMAEEDLLQQLRENGIEAGGFEERYGADGFGNSVYLQDPDGNTLELRIKTIAKLMGTTALSPNPE